MTRFLSPPAKLGLKAAALWVAIEVGMFLLGVILVLAASIPLVSGRSYVILQITGVTEALLLAAVFRRKTSMEDLSWPALGYTPFSRQVYAVGTIAGVALLLLVGFVTGPLDLRLFPYGEQLITDGRRMLREGGVLGASMLLFGNGILTPFVEEFAWRGYIQSKLVLGWGGRVGIVAAALLFAAKHAVREAPLFRPATLLLGASALGLIRARWGTTTTTVIHLLVNVVATSFSIAEAL